MRKSILMVCVMLFTVSMTVLPAAMQDECTTETRLDDGQNGQVAFTDGNPLNVRDSASLTGEVVGKLPEGTTFTVVGRSICSGNIYWWHIQSGDINGWIAEAVDGVYLVEPQAVTPATPVPALSDGVPFATWDWATFSEESYPSNTRDPMTISVPAQYAGDMPSLPVALNNVLFVDDANLNNAQQTLLAQNGFVVVPAGLKQFNDGYDSSSEGWDTYSPEFNEDADPATQMPGHPVFVTTDSMLHGLHYIFDNMLVDLEKSALIQRMQDMTFIALSAALQQVEEAKGTALEIPAKNAALYLLVAQRLLTPDDAPPEGIDAALMAEADELVAAANAGEGQVEISFLPGYTEDFSQYRPRGHYSGDAALENYFRGMMWLSRITFRASENAETLTALMLLRALDTHDEAMTNWQDVYDTLTFLIGPVDDLGPTEYRPLAAEIFGQDLTLASLSDTAKVAAFQERLKALPGPRVNGVVLPATTQAEDVADLTRGFRLMGQRFTFDGYILQQLMSPYVGTPGNIRTLPLALDVPAAMGSDTAYNLAAEAGATNFEKYDTQISTLRGQVDALTMANWLENTYSGWLWTLKPLWQRDPDLFPAMMQTDAWLRKDLHTGLASYTELKHDTVLYAKQPTGFGGGGGGLGSLGYVEPNPEVFARISIVAALTYQGLKDRGIIDYENGYMSQELMTSANELQKLAVNSAMFANVARKELAGEPVTNDEYYRIEAYGGYLYELLYTLFQGDGEPDPVALVTDIASNTTTNTVLQEGVGGVDYIYVVVPLAGNRLQLARGAVFSYYEFVGDINQRMTDDEWRAKVDAGDLPARPAWTSAFIGQ